MAQDELFQVLIVNSTTPTLNIKNTNIGTSVAGVPTAPSPFNNVSLITGSNGILTGSSAILDTMPGGWDTANYRRIGFATMPEITANDLSLGLLGTRNINATVVPTDADLT